MTRDNQIHAQTVIRHYFEVLILLMTAFGAIQMVFIPKGDKVMRRRDRSIIAVTLVILAILQYSVLPFIDRHILWALFFISTYFFYGGFLIIYWRYFADLSRMKLKSTNGLAIDAFCEQFSISNREKDIIEEICNGLTNQQIADKLYISLQTVKDHTSRIYTKTDCSNRALLIKKANGFR